METSKCGEDKRSYIYIIDKDDDIIFANKEWAEFAKENGAEDLTAENVIGKNLWGYIQDLQIKAIYKAIFERVREGKPIGQLPFRCDSPNCRRFMEMGFTKHYDQIKIECRVIKEERRTPITFLGGYWNMSGEIITICNFCKKVRIPYRWVEVEDAVVFQDLQNAYPLPRIFHRVCPPCFVTWMRKSRSKGFQLSEKPGGLCHNFFYLNG